jgi:hypothetical protein
MNHRICFDPFFFIDLHFVHRPGKINGCSNPVTYISTHAGCLFFKMHHHFRPLHSISGSRGNFPLQFVMVNCRQAEWPWYNTGFRLALAA